MNGIHNSVSPLRPVKQYRSVGPANAASLMNGQLAQRRARILEGRSRRVARRQPLLIARAIQTGVDIVSAPGARSAGRGTRQFSVSAQASVPQAGRHARAQRVLIVAEERACFLMQQMQKLGRNLPCQRQSLRQENAISNVSPAAALDGIASASRVKPSPKSGNRVGRWRRSIRPAGRIHLAQSVCSPEAADSLDKTCWRRNFAVPLAARAPTQSHMARLTGDGGRKLKLRPLAIYRHIARRQQKIDLRAHMLVAADKRIPADLVNEMKRIAELAEFNASGRKKKDARLFSFLKRSMRKACSCAPDSNAAVAGCA